MKDELEKKIQELHDRLDKGRHYLMGVQPSHLTVEDALESFGYSRDGLT